MSAADRTHRLVTSIEIDAPAAHVWSVLTAFPRYPRWNPFVRSIVGEAEVGRTLVVSIHPPGGRAMRFRPTVLVVEPGRELRWKGKLLIPGLFDGEHWFRIAPLSDARAAFEQGEVFSGLLVPRFRPTLDDSTQRGFVAMNEALKREAERADAHREPAAAT
ncbi:hypothetical protein BURK1_00324 [Burkholderiales bacterium]|nr:hypothetical protein BURK1_00324 [Burkholderiales bacterium]